MSPAPISVREYDVVDVDPDMLLHNGRLNIYPEIEGKDYFQPRITKDGVQLQARGFVGVIPINDALVLHVSPRVPLGNLARLLSTVQHSPVVLPSLLRSYDVEPGPLYPSLISLYAGSLRTTIEVLSQQGLQPRFHDSEGSHRCRTYLADVLRAGVTNGLHHVLRTHRGRPREPSLARGRALAGAVRKPLRRRPVK